MAAALAAGVMPLVTCPGEVDDGLRQTSGSSAVMASSGGCSHGRRGEVRAVRIDVRTLHGVVQLPQTLRSVCRR